MADSDAPSRPAEPARRRQRNLPVPVVRAPDAESDGFFARLARALFGWKNGPTRADIEVVLEAAGPGEAGVSPEERTMIRTSWRCAGAGSRTSWCRAATSSPCSRTFRSANW